MNELWYNWKGTYKLFLAFLGGVYMRKLTPARVSYRHDFLISYRVYMMTGLFHISLFEGTLHVDKMHVWFKIMNITHALPVPVYRQTDFLPKQVVVSCLHDTVARFRTGVKFLPRYKNWGELAPGWLAPAWNLWWYHLNKYRAMRGNRSELAPGRKSPRCHVNTPLEEYLFHAYAWMRLHGPWTNPFWKISIFRPFQLLVFIA